MSSFLLGLFRRVSRQMAVFAISLGFLPHLTNEICVQFLRLLRRTLQGTAPLGLHHGQQVPDVDVTIELSLLFLRQFSLTG